MPGTAYITSKDIPHKARAWMDAVKPYAEHSLEHLIHPALMVIDMQRYFVDPAGRAFLPAARAILPMVVRLIEVFRTAGLPVLFTRHGHTHNHVAPIMDAWWRGRLLYEDDPDAELVPDVGAREEKMIIRKQYYDAFRGTALAQSLNRLDVEMLVICGVMTDLCVETTARAAFMEEFQPVVICDATATKTEELHLAALKTLAHGFSYVATTGTILELIA